MRTFFWLMVGLAACTKTTPDDTDEPVDADGDGSASDVDCDDDNEAVHPGAAEVCNELDDDCDGTTDVGATDAVTYYPDGDADGYGVDEGATVACAAPDGTADASGDCDDNNAAFNPGAAEDDCTDPNDYDCDGTVAYADADEDGSAACLDCDDLEPRAHPGGTEVCDGVDNDCDSRLDVEALDESSWYADDDGDTFGDPDDVLTACEAPDGYVADASDCDDGDSRLAEYCFPRYTGATGTEWESLATSPTNTYSLISYKTQYIPYVYNMYPSQGGAYDPSANTWTTLTASAPYANVWSGMAPYGEYLYMLRNGQVYSYQTSTDTWDNPAETGSGDDYNTSESDAYGTIYGHASNGDVIVYDSTTNAVTFLPTDYGSLFETRMAYDPDNHALFFGAFYAGNLYRMDLATGDVTEMTSHPESFLNDVFCGDRSGHIFAAGSSGGVTMWMYDIASDTWSALPDFPEDHGNNGSCTVTDDGWLYVGTGDTVFYRLSLELE